MTAQKTASAVRLALVVAHARVLIPLTDCAAKLTCKRGENTRKICRKEEKDIGMYCRKRRNIYVCAQSG